MEQKSKIQRVKDGKEKEETYRKYLGKYHHAIKHECYLEAIMVEYAMLEDRLLAILHHLGIVSRNQPKLKVNKKYRERLIQLGGWKENCKIDLNKISTKMNVIKILVHNLDAEEDGYYGMVRDILNQRIDKQAFDRLMENIELWCDVRNQYVHALMQKKYSALNDSLCIHAEKGMELARQVDQMVKIVKKNNTIRSKFNIQDTI